MEYSMLSKLEALRDEAMTPVKVLDEAIVKMGGKSVFNSPPARNPAPHSTGGIGGAVAEGMARRQTHVGAAIESLLEHGEPMTVHQLMAELPSKGVILGGDNPQINFTSSLSKSGKFRSERRGGSYYWWFKNEPLPPSWQEAPDLPLQERSDASVVGNQEGGEAYATAT